MTAKRRSNLTYDHVANRPRPGQPYQDPPYTPDIERAMLAVAEAGFSVLAHDTWIDNLAVNSILVREGCGVPRTDKSIAAAMEKEGTLTNSGTLTPAGYRRLCQLRHPVAYWLRQNWFGAVIAVITAASALAGVGIGIAHIAMCG